MMVDEEQSTLTPDEAGAFVSQWAERRNIDVSELAERLGVDESQATSLLRQARGRLHRDEWVRKKNSQKSRLSSQIGPILGGVLLGVIVGCLAMKLFTQSSSPAEDQKLPPDPQIKVTTSDNQPPPQNNPNSTGVTPPSGGAGASPPGPGSFVGHPIGPSGAISPPQAAAVNMEPQATVNGPRFFDLSNTLATPIPGDLMVELGSPMARYTCRGPAVSDVQNALNIDSKAIEGPIRELVSYAIEKELSIPRDRTHPMHSKSGRILISMGRALASTRIAWNFEEPEKLRLEESVDAKCYGELSSTLIKSIKEYGPTLFLPRGKPRPTHG